MIPGAEVINLNYMHVRNPDELTRKRRVLLLLLSQGADVVSSEIWSLLIRVGVYIVLRSKCNLYLQNSHYYHYEYRVHITCVI